MKANELRIGNWIKGDTGIEFIISGVGIKNLEEIPDAGWEPIPLTEEWLLKFGFKKNDNIFYHPNYPDYELENHSRYDGIWGMGIEGYLDVRLGKLPETIYVHQLQNLYFALTGEELITSSLPDHPAPRT